jgi:hypothetical protein
MFIPKSKMNLVIKAINTAIQYGNLNIEEKELLYQIHDQASLCLHGDANFLEIEVYYGHKPE